jgi:hypothetical protein
VKNVWIYILTAALLYFAVFHLITPEQALLLTKPDMYEVAVSVLLVLVIFFISGSQFSMILDRTSNLRLSLKDRIFFPAARNLWSYIIPFQGSFAYSLAFTKFKYGATVKEGLSLNIYLLLFNFFFAGIIGIYYVYESDDIPSVFLILCVFMVLIPLLIIAANKLISNINEPSGRILSYIYLNIGSVSSNLTLLWKDLRFSSYVFIFSILHTTATALWISWTVKILEIDIDIISVVFLSLILKISLVFKITPGNLGVEQLVFGGLFSLMNYDPHAGVLISLFNKAITIFISLTAGSVFTIVNLKYFKTDKIKEVLRGEKW